MDYGPGSSNQLVFTDARHEDRLRRANGQLITGLLGRLPRCSDFDQITGRSSFSVRDPYKAAAVQASAVLFRNSWPQWLIGEHPTVSAKWTEVLLSDAHSPNRLIKATVKTAILKANHEAGRRVLSRPPAAANDELEALYAQGRGAFEIDADHLPRRLGDFAFKGAVRTALNGAPGFEHLEATNVTNAEMAAFDVREHLGHLATVFGLESQYEQLVAQRDRLPDVPPAITG